MIFLWKINNALNMVIIITTDCEEKDSFWNEGRAGNPILPLIWTSFFVEPEGFLCRMMLTSTRRKKKKTKPLYFSVMVQLSSTFFLITACFKAVSTSVRLLSWPGYRVRNQQNHTHPWNSHFPFPILILLISCMLWHIYCQLYGERDHVTTCL